MPATGLLGSAKGPQVPWSQFGESGMLPEEYRWLMRFIEDIAYPAGSEMLVIRNSPYTTYDITSDMESVGGYGIDARVSSWDTTTYPFLTRSFRIHKAVYRVLREFPARPAEFRKTLKDPNIGVNGMVCPALEEDPDTHANCITCGGKGICSREQWQHYYEALEEALQVKECSPQCGICIYPKCDECLKDTCCKDAHTELELFTLVATAYQVIEGKDLDLGNSEDGWTIPEGICDNPQALIRYLNLVCSRNGIE